MIDMNRVQGIPFLEGTVLVRSWDNTIVGYQLKKDNPAHCLQIFGSTDSMFTEIVNIALYQDQITIKPRGKDGFVIKFAQPIKFEMEPPKNQLPDPEKEGKFYRLKQSLHAVKMDKDFEIRREKEVIIGKKGNYLVKDEKGHLWRIEEKDFEERYGQVEKRQ